MAHLPLSLKYKRMLLFVLRRHNPDLPNDPRTLLFTPRTKTCKAIAGGVYVYVGLRIGLRKAWLTATMHSELRRLNVVLNTDGVSLHGSSRKQIWPILATVSELAGTRPFGVDVFWGVPKPMDVEAYPQDTINEPQLVLDRGYTPPNDLESVPVHLSRIFCDKPARTKTCKAIAGGVYVYVGLRIGLRKAWLTATMHSELRRLNVVLNTDGVSLHGSSRKQIWPILATVSELAGTMPFVVGVFWGVSKPMDVEAYPQDTISELQLVLDSDCRNRLGRKLTAAFQVYTVTPPASSNVIAVLSRTVGCGKPQSFDSFHSP
ncbi:hypothetical protein CLF_105057 [Clonorchis sinensis]|uniref:Uncharacterized protein n=1 Tax=Clonorchis sinensis TaxID=79923 RepID=G7YCW7_CLOSI|nr:hypothetical protein CLF_105057 [Clonorchis sinensis]